MFLLLLLIFLVFRFKYEFLFSWVASGLVITPLRLTFLVFTRLTYTYTQLNIEIDNMLMFILIFFFFQYIFCLCLRKYSLVKEFVCDVSSINVSLVSFSFNTKNSFIGYSHKCGQSYAVCRRERRCEFLIVMLSHSFGKNIYLNSSLWRRN